MADLHQMALTMILARLQAEGRSLNNLTSDELAILIKEAVADLKLAIETTQ